MKNFFLKNKSQIAGHNRGFTLIESVIYTALVISLSVLLITMLSVMYRVFSESRATRDLLTSSQGVMERMTREIRGATSIDTVTSVFGTSPGTLKLNKASTTVQFALSSGAVAFTDNGTLAGNLTSSQVTVTSLIFRKIVTTNSSAVRIEMTLRSLRAPSSRTITVYDTAVLRGGY
jgi:type II secretory pathway component PulJ